MSLDYEAQLRIKENHLKEKLKRIAEVDDEDYFQEPIIGMDNPYFYRNKTEFAVSKKGIVGFNKAGTNQVVDIPKCYIASPVANIILPILKSFFGGGSKGISKVTVRTSFTTGETMVIFHCSTSNKNALIPLVEDIDFEINSLCSNEVNNCNEEPTLADKSLEEDTPPPSLESVYIYDESKKNAYILIAGKRTIEDEMMGLKFEMSPASFYQTNPTQTRHLFAKVREYAFSQNDNQKNCKKIFDLYCGVGSIGLSLASEAEEILGIEVVKDAILDANRNAVINRIVNARYIAGKAEEKMSELSMDGDSIILLDPPRAGCKREVLDAIGESSADKLIYVSCDPATLARDIKILGEFGLRLKKITPVDMFPHTNHLECVVLMQ